MSWIIIFITFTFRFQLLIPIKKFNYEKVYLIINDSTCNVDIN
jgi:hypothetical protein